MGYGLLEEMSLVQLKQRLEEAKLKKQEEIEKVRYKAQEQKEQRAAMLEQKAKDVY